MTVFEDNHFHLQPCYACPLPGYLILSAKDQSETLHDLPLTALSSLGPTLAMISRSIYVALKPERIYTALFCEAERGVHFHIFPRTAWLRESYLTYNPSEDLLDGPRLLSWARRKFTQSLPEWDVESTSNAIQKQLTGRSTDRRPSGSFEHRTFR
jgi:diadenosine tetraphosphate (Ap4A) HIT family hydrolase